MSSPFRFILSNRYQPQIIIKSNRSNLKLNEIKKKCIKKIVIVRNFKSYLETNQLNYLEINTKLGYVDI